MDLFAQFRLSDSEYIARARRAILLWRRFGRWFAGFWIAALIAVIVLIFLVLNFLQLLMQPAQNGGIWFGVVFGTGIGIFFGWMFHNTIHGLIRSLDGLRCERLLLKYYDLANADQTMQDERASDAARI